MNINKTDAVVVGLFTVLYILLCIIFYSETINFLENHISPDGYIEFPVVVFMMIYISALLSALTPVLLYRDLARNRVVPKDFIIVSFAILIHLLLYIWWGEKHSENDIFEWSTFVLALSASIFFLFSGKGFDWIRYGFSALFFMFAMEEVSWGQQIFSWTSPAFFEKYNTQNETNLHNFLSPVIGNFYIAFFLIIFVFLKWQGKYAVSDILLKSTYLKRIFQLSDKAKLWAFASFACVASMIPFLGLEYVEEIFSILGFFVSIHMFSNRGLA